MKPKELLRLVWINITQNKFKVVMTSIGIIVGAATIVMVIAIGKGGQADVADQFKNLNAGAVDISYDGGTDFGGGGSSCSCILWIICLLCCCGNNNGCGCNNNGCCNDSCWIIILLLLCCGNNGCGCNNCC